MKRLKKMIVLSVMMMTVFSMSVVVAPKASAASAGDLIKMDGLSSVYYLGADGKRYVFPNESTYFSWYSDFSSVVTIAQSELESYPLGKNITVRPGTKLVKITTNPNVYAVTPGGKLLLIPSEDVAKALYGEAWASRVVDIADAFFTNYEIVSGEASATAYPAGSLVKFGGADVYYIDADGKARLVTDEAAFEANKFRFDFVIDSSLTMPTAGADITAKEDSLSDTAEGAGGVAGAGTGMSAALASDTPASGNIPENISVEMLKFNLTAANDGDVSVSTITLSAGGLGDSADINEVALYVNGVKYGNSKDITSDDTATFNLATPIVVSAGATKTVTVKAQVAGADTYNLYVASASDIVTNGAAVSGAFPIVGNTMSGVNSTVGGLTFDADDNDDTAQVGENAVSAVTFTAEATDEDVYFSGLTLTNDGNIDDVDTGVFTLVMNDDEIATAQMMGDVVSFTFDPITIEEDNTEDFEVFVDIEGGSANDTLTLYIDDDADVSGVGRKGYPVAVTRTAFDDDDGDSTTITLEAGDLVINFDGTAVSAQDILADTDNVVLGRLELTANAEAVTIDDIAMTVEGTAVDNNDLENIEMIGVGSTVGSYDFTAAFSVDHYNISIDDDIYIAKGETLTFDIRADVTANAEANDKYQVVLADSDIDAEGDESGDTITDITPSSVDSKFMTVVASGLTHTILSYGNQTAIAGGDEVVAYKGRLTAATASDVKVTKIVFEDDDNDGATDFNDTDVSLVTFEAYDQNGTLVNSETETTITDNGTSENYVTFNDDFIVSAGDYVDLYLKVEYSSGATTNDAYQIRVKSVSAKNDGENDDTVTVTPETGYGSAPTITLAENGYLDVTMSVTETEANSDMYVTAGKTSGLMATLKFDAQDEDIVVEDLYLMATEDDANIFDDIAAIQLIDEDGVTVLDQTNAFSVGDYDGDSDTDDVLYVFEDWNYTISESGIKDIYINVITNEIGTNEQVGNSGTEIEFSIYSITANGSDGELTMSGAASPSSSDTNSNWENDQVTNLVTNAGIIVTGIVDDIETTTLTGGENVIGRFKFAFDDGNNTDADGNDAEFNLEDLELTIGTDVTSLGGIEIYWESDETTTVASTTITAGGTYTLDLSSLAGVSAEDVLVVKASNVSGYTDHYAQSKLLDVDTSMTWNDGTGGSTLTGVLLDYVDITCDSLSN